ncbi:hypothetical protein [Polycladomyces zharkentensis]|nr:hypothetical protein [Polycladomyces sp. WAk]
MSEKEKKYPGHVDGVFSTQVGWEITVPQMDAQIIRESEKGQIRR